MKQQVKSSNLEKFLTIAIKLGLGLTLLTPLFISTSTYFPFVVGKAIAFQILVEIISLLYLVLIFIAPKYRPKFNFLTWAILIYFAIITVSSIFGFDFSFSFWTNYERMDGLFNLYHFGAYFLVLSSIFKTKKEWLWFLRLILVTFIFIDFLGLLQKMGLSYLAQFGGARAFSTLGNATYLGTMGVFQIFLALFLFLADRDLWWRFLYFGNAILGAMAILISQTRGSLLAVFLGAVIFLILGGLFSGNRKIYLGIFAGLGILLALSAFLFSHPNWAITKLMPARFNFVLNAPSLGTRGYVWKINWEGWKDKFWLGWGRSSNNYTFARHYDPITASYEDVWFDKPHNKILEVGSDSGISGLLAYLAIIGGAIVILWKKRESLSDSGFVLIAFIAAYFIQNAFLFDSQGSYLWWYSVLGFISYISFQENRQRDQKHQEEKFAYTAILLIGSVILGFAFVQGNIKPVMAARRGVSGLRSEYQGKPADVTLPIYQSALKLNTFGNQEIISEMSKAFNLVHQKLGSEGLLPYLDFAIQEEEKIYQKRPHDLKNNLILASLYQTKSNFEPSYIDQAEKIYQDFIKQAPNKFEGYFELASISFKKGEFDKMIEYINKTIDLNPNYYRPFWEAAKIHFLGKQKEQGRILLARAIAQKRFPWTSLFSAKFLEQDDKEWFINIFERLSQVENNLDKPHFILAGLYITIDKKITLSHLKKAIEINPDNREGIEKMGIKIE
jgi:O-antigen ligase